MPTKGELDLQAALRDPSAVFESPGAVADDPRLGREDKLRVLKRWESDARALAVAEEENMAGGEGDVLRQVLEAVKRLESRSEDAAPGPTKTG